MADGRCRWCRSDAPTPVADALALAFVYAAAPLAAVVYHVVGPAVTPLVRRALRAKRGAP